MSDRQPLRKQLVAAWRETLRGPYMKQLINSERMLQVHFCIALMKEFNAARVTDKRRFFIEPTIHFDPEGTRCPDLVICNSRRIIGVVELKYAPRFKPKPKDYIKDLETLGLFDRNASDVRLENERFKGGGKVKKYPLAEDAVLCWAAIYPGRRIEIRRPSSPTLGKRFLRLDAKTHKSMPPTIHSSHGRCVDA